MNASKYSHLSIAFARSHAPSPECQDFVAKTAAAGALDRAGRGHFGCRGSGFGQGRRAAFHHGAGSREGRRQRRIALSVFPNKAAILFRLQSDEWRQTSELLRGILAETNVPPLERLRTLVHAFIRSECDEAAVRGALDDAAPLYRDAPEAREAIASAAHTMQIFLREALPRSSDAVRSLAGDLITTTFSAVGKSFSETPRRSAEIEAYADAMADMFCAYLRSIEQV
jgi:AcrR family transcriptional regulator